jgi:hypothetical protein
MAGRTWNIGIEDNPLPLPNLALVIQRCKFLNHGHHPISRLILATIAGCRGSWLMR